MRTLALIALLALATACGKDEAKTTPDTSGDSTSGDNPAKTMMKDVTDKTPTEASKEMSGDMPKGAPAMRTVTLDITGMS